jgi:hypothetical protein
MSKTYYPQNKSIQARLAVVRAGLRECRTTLAEVQEDVVPGMPEALKKIMEPRIADALKSADLARQAAWGEDDDGE